MRANAPSGISRPSDDVSEDRSTEYGPATRAVMYEEMRGVGANVHVEAPTEGSVAWVAETGFGYGSLLTTCHAAGAVTVNWNVALRSGCSNTANTRRESGTSNCV